MYSSEVARLREQIELQLEAMQSGLRGLAYGRARHAFIFKCMERVGAYQDGLTKYIGENGADQTVFNIYVKVMEHEQSSNKAPCTDT